MTEKRTLDLVSEGTRLAADIFSPSKPAAPGGYPAILLCHGWGGLKAQLEPFVGLFIEAGFCVMTFDYRGWGESDGRIIADDDNPRLLKPGVQTLSVRVLRETIDPIERAEDVLNCIAFLASEPTVNPDRIALWGTSYGAGHAVYVAGNDDRVKAVVAQVGGFGFPAEYREAARSRAADKVRRRIRPSVPQDGLDAVQNLLGTPDIARMAAHSQLSSAAKVRVPTLIIDAEHEELLDRLQHGWAVYLAVRENAIAQYDTFPCKHYDIYERFRTQALSLALDWYQRYV